jgi:hypothetical protein
MFEFPKQKVLRFEFGTFEIVSDFGFRASDLKVYQSITIAVCDLIVNC